MISQEIKLKLLGMFEQVLERQKVIEKIKIALAQNPHASPKIIFSKFSNYKQKIGPLDFQNLFKQLDINFDDDGLYAVFSYFDYERNGWITYDNLLRKIMPLWSSKHRQKLLSQNDTISCQKIHQTVKQLLKNLFQQLLQAYQAYELCRSDLFSQNNFYIPSVFRYLDYSKLGYFANSHLKKFLKENDFNKTYSNKEIQQIMLGLNPRYKKLILELFAQFINPFQKKYEKFDQAMKMQKNKDVMKLNKQKKQTIMKSSIEDEKMKRENEKIKRKKLLKQGKKNIEQKKMEEELEKKRQEAKRQQIKRKIEQQRNDFMKVELYMAQLDNEKKHLQKQRKKLLQVFEEKFKQQQSLKFQQIKSLQFNLQKEAIYNNRKKQLEKELFISSLDYERERIRQFELENQFYDIYRNSNVKKQMDIQRKQTNDMQFTFDQKLIQQRDLELSRQKLRLRRQLERTRAELQLRKSNLYNQELIRQSYRMKYY